MCLLSARLWWIICSPICGVFNLRCKYSYTYMPLTKKNQTGDLVVLCNLNKTVEITILHKELWNKGKQLRHRKLNTVFKYFAGWMLSKKNADSHDCVCVWDLESRSEKYYLCTPSPLVEEPLGLSSPCLKACILWASPFFQCFLLDCG